MAAGDIYQKWGTSGQAIGITIASLANNGARQSDEINLAALKLLDVLVQLKVKSGAASTAATGLVQIWVGGTVDAGTTRSENAGASDAAITLTVPPNLAFVGAVNVVANAVTYYSRVFSLKNAFGGAIPERIFLVLVNASGGTLDATGGSHLFQYQLVLGHAEQ